LYKFETIGVTDTVHMSKSPQSILPDLLLVRLCFQIKAVCGP